MLRPDQMLALIRVPISLAGQPECLQLMLNAPGACSCSACAPGPMTPAHQFIRGISGEYCESGRNRLSALIKG
eukprot:scaffold112230_cov55-Phaeocystis_antarctica.AAC.1